MMNEQPSPSPDQARTAAANAVAPDPVTAQLIAKHAAGEKLTQAEYGRVGAFKAWINRVRGKSDAPGQPAPGRTGDAVHLESMAPAEASPNGLPVPAPDANLVQRTTGAILTRLEGFAQRKLSNAAREADPFANPKTLARVDRAANLPPDDKALLIELSPDVARELGIDPKSYSLWVFFGVLGLWGSEMWLAIDELKQQARERKIVTDQVSQQGATPRATVAAAQTP